MDLKIVKSNMTHISESSTSYKKDTIKKVAIIAKNLLKSYKNCQHLNYYILYTTSNIEMTWNPAFYRPAVLSKEGTIEFEKYRNTPATKEEIKRVKNSDKIYREATIRSAKLLKKRRAMEKEKIKEEKAKEKLAKKKEAEKKLKAKEKAKKLRNKTKLATKKTR